MSNRPRTYDHNKTMPYNPQDSCDEGRKTLVNFIKKNPGNPKSLSYGNNYF